jgi:AraC-like DNA-binding protein
MNAILNDIGFFLSVNNILIMLYYKTVIMSSKYDKNANNSNIMLKEIRMLGYKESSMVFPARTVPLHSMLTSCGHSLKTSTDYSWDGLKRGKTEFILWQYTVGGFGRLEYEGKSYDLTPGKGILVHIPHDHRYYFPGDSQKWEFIYACFSGREVLRVCREIVKRTGPVNNFDGSSKTLKTVVQILKMAYAGQIITPYISSSLAYQLAMSLMDDLMPESSGGGETPEFMKKINEYCRNNPDIDLNVDDLAKISGYSRYHFTRLFTAKRGIPPGAFIRELRLNRAVKFLQAEKMSVKEVASRCGFEDTSYFCKAFRKSFGVSPAKFRNSGMY